ncbi:MULTISPECIES: [glutamate--ammonia-ligase] adenylyltransferase [unclassified Sphingomonas]|uniref:[protein-PII] uridylyltransferase family protein n=1 Tax=unclassified Sphingomonas TaxID=196159 RepID=UPI0006F8A258|nr:MULTISPECIES: [glutamate--ammonia-ligase] adenylyltransferase [unclassified Sphingomonas]KQX17807.1 glutamate-ammonia-ligase adenylyltransferase [Sphingomonas sp. Root1294]KQY70733.1 glutamate-ammonia-ligase adenylyltransferase [Sphingomonas sp. Root50]KRB91774.1 glutamate-ammonia-ligase adenylyltransferase [Sphingomonas sp. Root720]
MRHEPTIRVSAPHVAEPAADRGPGSAQLLAELERRCLGLRTQPGAGRIDALFARLDAFAVQAADLIAKLADPAALSPSARRCFERAHADLGEAFGDVERLLTLPTRLGIPTACFSEDMLAATAMIAMLAPVRADADRLHETLSREMRALLHPDTDDALEARLVDSGFADPLRAARRMRGWQQETSTDRAESDALDALLPAMIDALERYQDPDTALAAFDEIVGRLPADIALFAPLRARPALLRSLLGLLGHAPDLARHLIAQPALIRRLIDGSAFIPLSPPADLDTEFGHLIGADDRQAGHLRIAQAIDAHRFGLGLRLIERKADPLDIAAAHGYLAEAGLRTMADDALSRMREKHGVVPGSELVVLALGRFGGGALTGRSDLDIVYLFTGNHRVQSDGHKPLDANEYYCRVAQQITNAMATVTTMGPLYEIDTRLRPWGAKGLLACSVESFERYHFESAWTWEHMALTRARPVYGSDAARKAVKAIVGRRLRQPRDGNGLLLDAVKMRRDIARHKPPQGPFDVKLVRGGLVDLEFAVHVNQLGRHVGIHPHLRTAIRAQVKAGLLDPAVAGAHETLTRLLVVLRLLSPHGREPAPQQRSTIARACGYDHWERLEADYGAARVIVQESWQATVARAMTGGG